MYRDSTPPKIVDTTLFDQVVNLYWTVDGVSLFIMLWQYERGQRDKTKVETTLLMPQIKIRAIFMVCLENLLFSKHIFNNICEFITIKSIDIKNKSQVLFLAPIYMFIVFATEGVISELCIASHLCVTSDVKPHSLLLLFLGIKQYPWLPIFVFTEVPIIALSTPEGVTFA